MLRTDRVTERVGGDVEAVPNVGEAAARPSRAEAEAAVRTLIRWAGDDPEREGLAATPARPLCQ